LGVTTLCLTTPPVFGIRGMTARRGRPHAVSAGKGVRSLPGSLARPTDDKGPCPGRAPRPAAVSGAERPDGSPRSGRCNVRSYESVRGQLADAARLTAVVRRAGGYKIVEKSPHYARLARRSARHESLSAPTSWTPVKPRTIVACSEAP
jgi:hypothetical protein